MQERPRKRHCKDRAAFGRNHTLSKYSFSSWSWNGHAEYDVPQCPENVAPEDCTHEIWGVMTPAGTDLHLAAIHMHCHATIAMTFLGLLLERFNMALKTF